MLLLILWIFIIYYTIFKPYERNEINKIAILSIMCYFISVFLKTLDFSLEINNFRILSDICVLMVNITFLLIIIIMMLKLKTQSLKSSLYSMKYRKSLLKKLKFKKPIDLIEGV